MARYTKEFLFFLVTSLTIRGLYVFWFSHCNSFDLSSWNQVGTVLMTGGNPYHLTSVLNWPPFWMQLIFLFKELSLSLHLPFDDIVRAFLIVTESGMALLLYATIVRYVKSANALRLLIFGIALNPICIFQVCQHCNFDVLVSFWILLAVYMLLRFQEQHESRFWLAACFALGMGTLSKTVPLCLAPLLLLSVRKLKLTEQALGMALLLVPVILGLSILYVLGPEDIKTKVLDYRSTPGFGFTGLFAYFGSAGLLSMWPRIFEIIYGIGWIGAGAWLLLEERFNPQQTVSLATVVLLAIPALGPGYGLQYIYWFLPLLVLMYGLEGRNVRIFLLIFYGVTVAIYTIEYAFDFYTHGAFTLEISRTERLIKFIEFISAKNTQFYLLLPLWLLYLISVFFFGAKIARSMLLGFKAVWQRNGTARNPA